MRIQHFTFNPFSENTYVVSDEKGVAAIIDPGCAAPHEQQALLHYIENEKLTPQRLLCTHCHIDHILGNAFVYRTWGLQPEIHRAELDFLHGLPAQSEYFGVAAKASPEPVAFLEAGTDVTFGDITLKLLFTPGHSPGSLCFYQPEEKFVISGDVLFLGSIGRTDLPMGSLEVLMQSIYQVLLLLGDDVKVYPGHGPATTIGHERRTNPFLQ